MSLTILFVFAAAVAAYVWLVRPVLRRKAALAPYFDEADAVWVRLATALRGLRTILVARLHVLAGVLLATYEVVEPAVRQALQESGFDWRSLVPAGWGPLAVPAILIVSGLMFGWLRRITTGPVAE